MKTHFTSLAVATLLVVGFILPGYAEDAAAPKVPAAPATTQAPAAAQTEAPPASVPRPSLAPKTAEPASPPAGAEPAPRHRRYAHRHYRRYAYWEPFPIYWPHFYRSRVHWSRIPWAF